MAIKDYELDYSHHLAFYERLGFLSGDPQKDATWHRKAEYMHSVRVWDAIRDTHLAAVALGQSLGNHEAKMHLTFGVGRRTKFIWLSLRNLIFDLVHPERNEPLENDAVETAAMDLNVIYINIRGALDNFAWCLLTLFGGTQARQLANDRPTFVNLFGRDFKNDGSLSEVAAIVDGFAEWSKDLKARRDPAAHRIPLSVVPALIDDATKGDYVRLQEEWSEVSNAAFAAVARGEDGLALFQEAEAIFERLQRVGKFHPLFGHDPSEGLMKIYPVPQDIGELVRVARKLISFITALRAAHL